MTKLRLTSDLHLEFIKGMDKGKIERYVNMALPVMPDDKETVLIVAGDLCSWHKKEGFKIFFDIVSPRFRLIIYIDGNHSYYGGIMSEVDSSLKMLIGEYPNICTPSDLNAVGGKVIDDRLFIFHTLWTDFDRYNKESMLIAQLGMNDYNHIYKEEHIRITPEDIYQLHYKHRTGIQELALQAKGSIVITHHLPSFKGCDPRYRNDPLNCAYASDLEQLILDIEPRYWFNGHTHTPMDYMIGDCRVICNPKGYAGQENNGYNSKLLIEV